MDRQGILLTLMVLYLSVVMLQAQSDRDSLLSIAQNHYSKSARAEAYLQLGVQTDHADLSIEYLNRSLKLYQALDDCNKTGMVLREIALKYNDENDNNTALDFHKQSLRAFQSCNNTEMIAKSLYNVGRTFWHLGAFNESLQYHHKSLKLYETLNDSSQLGQIFNGIGSIHWFINDYDQAYDYFLRALRIRRAIEDSTGIVLVLNNIGLVFQDWGDLDNALKYHDQALQLALKVDYPFGIAYSEINLGLALYKNNRLQESLDYFSKAVDFYYNEKDPGGIAYIQKYLADVYNKKGQNQRAIRFYEKSLDNALMAKNTFRAALAQYNLARMYHLLGEYAKAQTYIEQSLAYANEQKYIGLLRNNYFLLSKIYEQNENYALALQNYKKGKAYEDSIFNSEKATSFNELQIQHQMEVKDKENSILKAENEVQKLLIQKQRLVRNSLIGIISLTLIIVFLFISRWWASQKTAKKLKKQNDHIKNINREKELLIQDLQSALNDVRQLRELLPICSNCKKIRDDQGYWNHVEEYIAHNAGIKFSHSICPDCMSALFPGFKKKKNNVND
ncbi:MAG: tetratricopeptide repeat protein [Caldithrix sp.]|nr:tetratricopeptide repeat protein [Caldithrix sp.]